MNLKWEQVVLIRTLEKIVSRKPVWACVAPSFLSPQITETVYSTFVQKVCNRPLLRVSGIVLIMHQHGTLTTKII